MQEASFQPIITLYDAITDSPVFRSSLHHHDRQLDQLEQWLDSFSRHLKSYTEKLNKLNVDTISLCQKVVPEGIDDTLIDPNFSGSVMKGFADALQKSLTFKAKLVTNLEENLISPLQQHVKSHLKDFKGFRKQFEKVFERYETQLAKYSAINKSKDPSSIREAAFRLHEARKQYVRMSGQYMLKVLGFRSLLERHLFERFSKATIAQKRFFDDIQIWTNLDAALSYWKHSNDKFTCSYQLYQQQLARKQLEDEFIQLTMPDRDIEKYVASTTTQTPETQLTYSKWGYLFVKARHSWNRKWFYLHGGYFGSGQVDKTKTLVTSDLRIRLTDCDINTTVDCDRRFCFELVLTNSSTLLVLQAETEDEMKSWIQVFLQNKHPVRPRDSVCLSPSANRSITQDFGLLQESSVVMISTTPDQHATLASSLSLTPLLVWEASRAGNSPIQQLPSGSWGIPWSLVPTMVNLTEDHIVQDDNNQTPLPHVIWPPKVISVDVPNVDIQGYTEKMNMLNKELRQLFSGVGSQEIVLDMFVCCLRKKPTATKEISTSALPTSDLFEDELGSPSTQPSIHLRIMDMLTLAVDLLRKQLFGFTIAVQLKDINEIKLIKDESAHSAIDDTVETMKPDMLLSISLIPNTQSETKEPLIFGFMIDDVQVIAESLKLAVENAKRTEPLPVHDLFDKMQSLSKESVVNILANSNGALLQIKETLDTQSSNRPESTVKIENVLKSASRQRGDSEPPPLGGITEVDEMPKVVIVQVPKPDPDMVPTHIECPKSPVQCNCDDHLDRQDIQINLPISAKRCFELMFSDEQNALPTDGGVWNQKTAAIEGHDLSVSNWSLVEGKMQRILKYWMPVANPIVRLKEAEVVETQILINKEDYIRYTVQISTKTAALPYADAFIPSVRYCITWVTKSECQLTCYLGVRWIKSVLVRAIVTRAALSGMSDSVHVFIPILTEAAKKIKADVDEERLQQIEYNTGLLGQTTTEHSESPKPLDKLDEAFVEDNQTKPIAQLDRTHLTVSTSSTVRSNLVDKTVMPSKSTSSLTTATNSKETAEIPETLKTEASSTLPLQGQKTATRVEPMAISSQSEPWFFTSRVTAHLKAFLLFALLSLVAFSYIQYSAHTIKETQLLYANITRDRFGCPAVPIMLSKSHSVYLRDLDKGIFTQTIQPPPYVQTRSFQTFLDLKQTNLIPPELDYVNDRHWYHLEHYKIAVDLFNSRERLALLRHELLSMFKTLNQRDAQLLEKEYKNWLMDTQLKCKHYPDLSPEDPRYRKATLLCQEVQEQLIQHKLIVAEK
ncbi:hypothetical protein BD560DRAFT_439570 [Blakeslea trispora]|nr:hypothetical protein BD560DRAFT_439570 [Blakeslea trispora]